MRLATHRELQHWTRLIKQRGYRTEHRTVIIEGKNLLFDLIQRHAPRRLILVENMLSDFSSFSGEIVVITEKQARKITAVESPEGCFAEYSIPVPQMGSIRRGLVLDRLSDPGNVGTLIRTAVGFSLDAIFLIEPCCDPWNAKTVRAAKGAQFDIPLFSSSYEQLPRLPLLVADLHGLPLHLHSPQSEWLLVLGNEAHGPLIPKVSYQELTIPLSGPIESLNVAIAGAIMLYALLKN